MNLLVNHVDNTVGDKDVRGDDLGRVDKNVAINETDVEGRAVKSSQGGVGQTAAVAENTINNVVLEDASEGLGRDVASDAADGGKGRVAGGKHGDVLEPSQSTAKVGFGDGADEGSQVGSGGGLGDAQWHGEDLVDDVDGATSEVEVLWPMLAVIRKRKLSRQRTAEVTVDSRPRPLRMTTLSSSRTPSTRWPPVTFVYVWLTRAVGTKAGVSEKAEA